MCELTELQVSLEGNEWLCVRRLIKSDSNRWTLGWQ